MTKRIIILGLVLSSLTGGISFAQDIDFTRLQEAQEELAELEMVNKETLTKAEKKAWRKEKRQLNRAIDRELDVITYQRLAQNPWLYGPYLNPVWGAGFGYARWGWNNPYRYRRVVVRRAPVCRR